MPSATSGSSQPWRGRWSYLDYGAFTPIQVAATAALNGPDDCIKEMRDTYRKRRDALVESLGRAGWRPPPPQASMFAWAPLPKTFEGVGSMQFATLMVEKSGVVVSPGVAFGEHGEGYVRIAMVENEQRIRQAARGVRRFLESGIETLHNVVPLPTGANSFYCRFSHSWSHPESGYRGARHRWRRSRPPHRRAVADAVRARSGRGVRVAAVTARSKAKSARWTCAASTGPPAGAGLDPNVDCFVELMGGSGEPALSAIEAALKSGKSVVTANKALIAKHGVRLAKAAEKHGGAELRGGGAAIPVIKTLREGLAGTGVNRVYGILNGTCNYILTGWSRRACRSPNA